MNIHDINDSHKHIDLVYFATSETDNVVPEDTDDKSELYKWVDINELETMDLKPDIKFYAIESLKQLSSPSSGK